MTETRTSRKWFSDGALDASDDVGICTMGATGLGCNSTFSICISGTSTPLKTVGNDKTIYHGRAARFPVENTSKMYWKHSKMIEIKQVTRWTREIYLSRSSCPRALCSSVSDRMNHFKYPRLTRDTICETNGSHAPNLTGIRPTKVFWFAIVSINRWSWTLSFDNYFLFCEKDVFYVYIYRKMCYMRINTDLVAMNYRSFGIRKILLEKRMGRVFRNLCFES